jgi:hypothetical protein
VDTNIDFNSIISNFERTAALKAEEIRKEAKRMRAQPSSGWPELDAKNNAQADQADAQAKAWDARAAAAREGYLLLDQADTAFQMANHDLIEKAAASGRIRYAGDASAPNPAVQWA